MDGAINMMILASFLTNSWTIGIGAGIVSGFVVFGVIRFIFSGRENREYKQKVLAANREVLHGIRPSISGDQIPTRDVIGSMVTATARRFGVDPSDMQSIETFVDDLVMEIMASSFISCQTKDEFCQRLADLKRKPINGIVNFRPAIFENASARAAEHRKRLVRMMSGVLAGMAALMTVFVTFLSSDELGASMPPIFALAVPPVMAISLALMTLAWTWTGVRSRTRRQESDKAKVDNDEVEDGPSPGS